MNRAEMMQAIIENHYTNSVPSGKSWYYFFESAIVCFSIPANKNISTWLLGEANKVLELSRLWAPDGHDKNLLSRAISFSVGMIKTDAPSYCALVSYADPRVGHHGGVYSAASWVALGVSEENRGYQSADGLFVSRRAFHSGGYSMKKAEIEAMGYVQSKQPGKIRFAKGLTRWARTKIAAKRRGLL